MNERILDSEKRRVIELQSSVVHKGHWFTPRHERKTSIADQPYFVLVAGNAVASLERLKRVVVRPSQLRRIELCRFAQAISSRCLVGQLTKRILGLTESSLPRTFIRELREQPTADPVLFFRRQLCRFFECFLQSPGHIESIPRIG